VGGTGGGLDDGETHEQAARREIAEETGHTLGQLRPWVWTREHVFRFEGRLYRQVERYFVAHVCTFDPLSQELGVEEAKALAELRWWTPAELEEAEEEFAPADLPALVRMLVESGPPERPIEVGAKLIIHRSAWKNHSANFVGGIAHKPPPRAASMSPKSRHTPCRWISLHMVAVLEAAGWRMNLGLARYILCTPCLEDHTHLT